MASITDIMPASVANSSGLSLSGQGASSISVPQLPNLQSTVPLPSISSLSDRVNSMLGTTIGGKVGSNTTAQPPITQQFANAGTTSAPSSAASGFFAALVEWAQGSALALVLLLIGVALIVFSLYAIFTKGKAQLPPIPFE